MKWITLLIVCLLPVVANAEIKNGFRDMKWGDAITKDFERCERESLERSGSSMKSVKYRRRSDKLAIGEVKVQSISYYFDDGKLREVLIQVDDKSPSLAFFELSKILVAAYGPPESTIRFSVFTSSYWEGGNTTIDLTYYDDRTAKLLNNGNVLKFIDKDYAAKVAKELAEEKKRANAKKGDDDL